MLATVACPCVVCSISGCNTPDALVCDSSAGPAADATIHRIGEARNPRPKEHEGVRISAGSTDCRGGKDLSSIERGVLWSKQERRGSDSERMAILIGLQAGAGRRMLSEIIGISSSALSRRSDAVRQKVQENVETRDLATDIIKQYRRSND